MAYKMKIIRKNYYEENKSGVKKSIMRTIGILDNLKDDKLVFSLCIPYTLQGVGQMITYL